MTRIPITAQHDAQLTVLGALVAAVRAAAVFDKNDLTTPAAILWPDEEKLWSDLLPQLRQAMPELLTLGEYDPAARTGPAIWIKCMLGRDGEGAPVLPEAVWDAELVPVVYMPGVGKRHIRAIEECSTDLKPLCELQYRGVLWTQLNGKDWTVRAFLQSADGGLGLQLAGDSATLAAMRQALTTLVTVPLERLRKPRGQMLDAADFHDLLTPDPARTLLDWLSDAAVFRARNAETWQTFRTVCRGKFGFDPEKGDALTAAELLTGRQGVWATVWSRYAENPRLYPGVREAIRRSKPEGEATLFASGPSIYPQDNEAAEHDLRDELTAVGTLSEDPARSRLSELEAEHGARRALVWARLGEAPLAGAMAHLAALAQLTAKALGGASLEDAAGLYADQGWLVDTEAMDALASVRSALDISAVGEAVAAVYRPWLERSAEHFQKLVAGQPIPGAARAAGVGCQEGECVVFADGLRMDLGHRLADELERRGLRAEVTWRWSTVPSVTATAKPAASPVARLFDRSSKPDGFVPTIADTQKGYTAERLRALLKAEGIEPLGAGVAGDPTTRAWLEIGTIDHRGHSEGSRLAAMLGDEVRAIADRVQDLVSTGWRQVTIVTDHGWLLLPGGLPKVSVPKYLVETDWRRCASVKEGANPDCQQHPWHWSPAVSIALAPGIACFRDGAEYAHGGLSVQECVTPVVTVRGDDSGGAAVIEEVQWRRLLSRVKVKGGEGCVVDLRRDAADASTSLLATDEPPPIDGEGNARLYARDDAEGLAADIVVLDPDGHVVARQRTLVGME